MHNPFYIKRRRPSTSSSESPGQMMPQNLANNSSTAKRGPPKMLPSIALNSSRPLYAIDHQATSHGKLLTGPKRQIRFKFGFASPDRVTGVPCRNVVDEHDVLLLWSPMISGRVIVQCDGQEVHNSVMRGVNMMIDVTWSIRGNHVLRIVAHATSASSKMRNGGRQYELFVDGVSYFNFLAVDQLKNKGTTTPVGHSVVVKRPVKRSSMFEKGGQHFNNEHYSSSDRRHSTGGEVNWRQRYPEVIPLDQSDRSRGSGVGQRNSFAMNNIDESETSRLSYQSDISPPLDHSDRSSNRGGKKLTKSLPTWDSHTPPLDQSDRSQRPKLVKAHSNLDGSARSSRMGKQISPTMNIEKIEWHEKARPLNHVHASKGGAAPLDISDRSRGRKLTKAHSNLDGSARSSSRHKMGRTLSHVDVSDRSARSRDPHHHPPHDPLERNRRHTVLSAPSEQTQQAANRNRRQTVQSVASEQTQKATNTSKSKVLQSYEITDKQSARCDDDDDDDNNSVDTAKRALRTSFVNVAKSLAPPKGNVTIVYTDVQGSTLLWESCPSAMKKAQDIHDMIMRQCYSNHKGYEISTEGDAFNIAFQHPVDALAFALQAQIKLYKADWPKEILSHPDGKDEPYLKFKGLRVRFGINHGPTTSQLHRVTGRTIYAGEGVKIAKALEGLCHGGQILCTVETWKAVGGLAERYLGRPQVMDCGEHVLFDANRTRYSRRIMQLVPNELAFDFFEARGQAEDGTVKDASLMKVEGRLFPPLPSKKQLTTSFLNAPYTGGKVVICFVYTVGLGDDEGSENRGHNLMKLSKNLRKLLLQSNPPGYECQEDNGCWMLAFGKIEHAVMFGLKLMASIREGGAKEHLQGDVDCDNMYKIGIVSGAFTSMGPHKTSGLADYFGPIVNRAARVASSCEPGQLCVGQPLTNGTRVPPPNFGPRIQVRLLGIKQLKGVTVDVAIYRCCENAQEDGKA